MKEGTEEGRRARGPDEAGDTSPLAVQASRSGAIAASRCDSQSGRMVSAVRSPLAVQAFGLGAIGTSPCDCWPETDVEKSGPCGPMLPGKPGASASTSVRDEGARPTCVGARGPASLRLLMPVMGGRLMTRLPASGVAQSPPHSPGSCSDARLETSPRRPPTRGSRSRRGSGRVPRDGKWRRPWRGRRRGAVPLHAASGSADPLVGLGVKQKGSAACQQGCQQGFG